MTVWARAHKSKALTTSNSLIPFAQTNGDLGLLTLHFAPNSRAVRAVWLLEELGLDYQLERYALGALEMRSPEFRKVHPMGRVPVLEDGDIRLFESGAIMEYLITRHGQGRLRPAEDSAHYPAYLQWLHYSEGMIMPPINSYMVETFFLPPERQSEVHAKRAKKLLGQMLVAVNDGLAGQEYLAGDFSAADIMTGSAVLSAQHIGVDLSEMRDLQAYCARLQARPAYQKASNT